MKLVICIQHSFSQLRPPEWFAERLRREFPIEVVNLSSYERLPEELAEAEVLISWSMRPEQMRQAPRLRWIHSTATAVHALLIPEVVERDIVVTNAREVHGPMVAEHVMGMIWALARQIPRARDYQRQKIWARQQLWDNPPRTRTVKDAVLLVVGLGAIGRPLAELAHGNGMRVMAVREHPDRPSAPAERVFGFEQLEEALPLADFVAICAPVTAKTTKLFNEQRLRRMKRGSYLLNVGRGIQVDEEALAKAITDGHLAGAGLDVFEQEPPPQDLPLWEMPQVLITPHMAAFDELVWEKQYNLLAENLRRYQSGQPLLSVVDKHKGY